MFHNQKGFFHVYLNGQLAADLDADGIDAGVVADLAVMLGAITRKQADKAKVFGYIQGNPLCWSVVRGPVGGKVTLIEFVPAK